MSLELGRNKQNINLIEGEKNLDLRGRRISKPGVLYLNKYFSHILSSLERRREERWRNKWM